MVGFSQDDLPVSNRCTFQTARTGPKARAPVGLRVSEVRNKNGPIDTKAMNARRLRRDHLNRHRLLLCRSVIEDVAAK